MLSLFRWLRPSPPALATTRLAVAVPDVYTEQTSEWFATEPEKVTQLALQTLTALIQASPLLPNASRWVMSHAQSIAWLPTAFETLRRLPTELTPPVSVRDWRYLVFTRVLCDALEAAYLAARVQHIPLSCPLTSSDTPLHMQNRVPPRHMPIDMNMYVGLGGLIVGHKLPAEGRARIAEACVAGIDWCCSEAFWAVCTPPVPSQETIPPPDHEAHPVSHLSLPADPPNPVNPPSSSPQQRQSPVCESSPAKPVSTAAQPSTPSHDITHLLTQAVIKGVLALTASTAFNRRDGDAWLVGDTIWVVAKALTQQIEQQNLLDEQPHLLARRMTLYQALVNHKVAVPHGGRSTWKVWVEEGTQHQQVTVLKLPATLIWPPNAERPPEFSGALRLV